MHIAINPLAIVIGAVLVIGYLIFLARFLAGSPKASARRRRPAAHVPAPAATPPAHPVAASPGQPVTPAPGQLGRPDPRSPYERTPALLTAAERGFYTVLSEAAPSGCRVFAQVGLAGLVQVKPWARQNYTHFNRIQAKRLDFVLVDAATLAPRLVIELDDASHGRADRRERDAFLDEVLAGVGLPILHVRCQRRYDGAALAAQIAAALGSAAPTLQPIAGPTQQPAPPPPFVSAWRPMPAAATPAIPPRPACGQCHARLTEGAKFCTQCGATVGVARVEPRSGGGS